MFQKEGTWKGLEVRESLAHLGSWSVFIMAGT